MRFTKMHGSGNDFVLLDARDVDRDWSRLAIDMCDRHYGVGGDGMLLVANSERADFRMRMFNPDGSEAEMCANGICCFAKYVVDQGLTPGERTSLRLETLAGLHDITTTAARGEVRAARVGMGRPILAAGDIPVAKPGLAPVIDYPIEVYGRTIPVTCVSMGNPHAVAFIDEPVDDWPLDVVGPAVERHPFFPNRVNFEIVNVLDRGRLKARVWERGAGLTLACGSGACALAVAARLKGLTEPSMKVTLPGGDLIVEWDGEGEVALEGPAERVFTGEWPAG